MSAPLAISADSHLNEPLELYERLPREFRSRAPRMADIDGEPYMLVEGQPPRPLHAPNPLKEEDMQRYWRDETESDLGRVFHRAGGTDVDLRLKDQDADGIRAEVIYPHGTFNTFTSRDACFQRVLARVYNDYYHELFGDYPDRFAVSAVIPMRDIDHAVEEATRVAKLGFRSLSIPMHVPDRPYNLEVYDPFWATVEELGIPLALHIFTEAEHSDAEIPSRSEPGEDLAYEVIDMAAAMKPMCLFIASGILERFPRLKFVLVECGIGWLAWVLQTLDQINDKRHMWIQPKLELKPSEYFKRQGAATFCDDEVGLVNRQVTGVETLLWGNDYPHDEGTFPFSRKVIDRVFKDIDDVDRHKVLVQNAANLYGFPA